MLILQKQAKLTLLNSGQKITNILKIKHLILKWLKKIRKTIRIYFELKEHDHVSR